MIIGHVLFNWSWSNLIPGKYYLVAQHLIYLLLFVMNIMCYLHKLALNLFRWVQPILLKFSVSNIFNFKTLGLFIPNILVAQFI